MAADNHASYAKIGLAVVLGTIAIILTLVHIAGIGDHSEEMTVETYFNDPVDGLTVGSPVNYRGVKVGEVRKLGFVVARYPETCCDADSQRVWVQMVLSLKNFNFRDPAKCEEILRERVELGLRATISTSPVTGLSRIEIGKPRVPAPIETLTWKSASPLIPPSPSLMSSLSDTLRVALDRFNRMDILDLWSNVCSVAHSSARVADGADRLIRSQRGGVGSIVRNLDDASQSARDLTERVRDNPSLLLRENDPEPLPETSK